MDRQISDQISLSASQKKFISRQVEMGHFPTVSKAVQRGIELLAQEQELLGLDITAVRKKLDRAARQIASGDVVDGDEFFARLRRLDRLERSKGKKRSPKKAGRSGRQ